MLSLQKFNFKGTNTLQAYQIIKILVMTLSTSIQNRQAIVVNCRGFQFYDCSIVVTINNNPKFLQGESEFMLKFSTFSVFTKHELLTLPSQRELFYKSFFCLLKTSILQNWWGEFYQLIRLPITLFGEALSRPIHSRLFSINQG